MMKRNLTLLLLSCSLFWANFAVGQVTATIGNGTYESFNMTTTPFGTLYMDDRTQILVTASEISAAGGVAGLLGSIAFNVGTVGAPAMSNLTISVGHAVETDLSMGYSAATLTTVYSVPSYTPTVGWNVFDALSLAPFAYNGTDNLVIDVCFDNNSWDAESSVITTSTSNPMVYSLWEDQPFGSMCSATSSWNGGISWDRPNVKLTFIPPVTNDVGIGAVISPSFPTCMLGTDICVTVQNLGTSALTSADIHWQVNGGSVNTFAWTGNIPSYSTGAACVSIGTYNFQSGDDLVVYASNPNSSSDLMSGNDTVLLTGISTGLNGTYSIPGDFSDINASIDAMNTFGVCGPVVFELATGTYTEQVDFNGSIFGLSAANSITYTSQSGDPTTTILEFAPNNWNSNYVVNFNDSRHIKFSKLGVSNVDPWNSTGRVFDLGSADSVTIDSCAITSGFTNTWSDGALIFSEDENHGVTISNNSLTGGAGGVTIYGNWNVQSSGNTIANNIFTDQNGTVIDVEYQNGVKVLNNTMTTSSTNSYNTGVYMYGCEEGTEIIGNKMFCSTASITRGIALYSCDNTLTTGKIINNCIRIGDGDSIAEFRGMAIENSGNFEIYHNSIHVDGGLPEWSSAAYWFGGGQNKVVNNSFSNAGYGPALTFGNLYGIQVSHHNNIHAAFADPFKIENVTTFATIQDWTSNFGFEENSVSAAPAFNDPTECLICSEELDKAGDASIAVTEDIDGIVRGTTPDIGTNEFIGPDVLGADTVVCGDELTIDLGNSFTSITWTSAGVTGPVITVDPNMTSPLEVAVTGNCGTFTDAMTVTFFAGADLSDDDSHLCAGDTIVLDAGADGDSYEWGNGESTQTLNVYEPGMYYVNVLAGTCDTRDTIMVTQSAAVELENRDVCDDLAPVTVDATMPEGATYEWSTGESTPTITLDESAEVTVTVTDVHNCESEATAIISIVGDPVPSFTHTHSLLTYVFENTSTGIGSNTTYEWNFGDGSPIENTENPIHIFPFSGVDIEHTVTLTVRNGICGEDASTEIISVSALGVEEMANGKFAVYPNPTSGNVTVVLPKGVSAGKLMVTDITGRTVMEQRVGAQISFVDLSAFAKGTYSINLVTESATYNNKVVLN